MPDTSRLCETAAVGDRQEAWRVLDRLAALGWPNDETEWPAEHRPFVRLYYLTTRHWLADLDNRPYRHLGYATILNFHRRFETCVAQVVGGQSRVVPPHWRRYFDVSGRTGGMLTERDRWQLVYHGLIAHTRTDLADAICMTDAQVRAATGRPPEARAFMEILLGGHTDALFGDAAMDFLDAEASHGLSGRTQVWASRMRTVWLPAFQALRRAAWRDAARRIEAGVPQAN